MSAIDDLRAIAPGLVDAVEALVAERVEAALAAAGAGETRKVWYTQEEAAEYLRCDVRTIQRREDRGRLKAHRGTGRPLYHVDELDACAREATGEDVAPTTSPRRRPRSLDRVGPGA